MITAALRGPLQELKDLRALHQREVGALRAQEGESRRRLGEQSKAIEELAARLRMLEAQLPPPQQQHMLHGGSGTGSTLRDIEACRVADDGRGQTAGGRGQTAGGGGQTAGGSSEGGETAQQVGSIVAVEGSPSLLHPSTKQPNTEAAAQAAVKDADHGRPCGCCSSIVATSCKSCGHCVAAGRLMAALRVSHAASLEALERALVVGAS